MLGWTLSKVLNTGTRLEEATVKRLVWDVYYDYNLMRKRWAAVFGEAISLFGELLLHDWCNQARVLGDPWSHFESFLQSDNRSEDYNALLVAKRSRDCTVC